MPLHHHRQTELGAELAAFLVLAPFASPSLTLQPWALVFSALTPFAMLLGPALFNPDCFDVWKAEAAC